MFILLVFNQQLIFIQQALVGTLEEVVDKVHPKGEFTIVVEGHTITKNKKE